MVSMTFKVSKASKVSKVIKDPMDFKDLRDFKVCYSRMLSVVENDAYDDGSIGDVHISVTIDIGILEIHG